MRNTKTFLSTLLALTLVTSAFGTAKTAADQLPGEAVAKTIKPIKIVEGLEVYTLTPGTGPEAKEGQTVFVDYTGYLLDKTKFDSSKNPGRGPFDFKLGSNRVIQGWEKGVKGMKKGEKRKLVIQPALGYGAGGGGPIPPNSVLVFDVELKDIK